MLSSALNSSAAWRSRWRQLCSVLMQARNSPGHGHNGSLRYRAFTLSSLCVVMFIGLMCCVPVVFGLACAFTPILFGQAARCGRPSPPTQHRHRVCQEQPVLVAGVSIAATAAPFGRGCHAQTTCVARACPLPLPAPSQHNPTAHLLTLLVINRAVHRLSRPWWARPLLHP